MANFTINITTDLSDQLKRYTLQTPLVQNNNMAHEFNVALMDGESEVPVENVSADFLRADGNVVPILGDYCTANGNVATVVLPEACYAVQGRATLTINVSSGDVKTCIGFFSCMVFKTTSASAVDPGTIIPSVEQLIEDIDEAVKKIPADYTALTEDVEDLKTEMQGKQDTLTFDSVPTAGSQNPVTSEGIKNFVGSVPPFEKGTGYGSAQQKPYTDSNSTYTQKANGVGAVAEGGNTLADGEFAHAEGYATLAHARGAHAEGTGRIKYITIPQYSGMTRYIDYTDDDPNNPLVSTDAGAYLCIFVDGQFFYNEKITNINTSMHRITLATMITNPGPYDSHKAAVVTCAALYPSSHAEGNNTISNQSGSHSEGVSTYAVNTGAHAEGKGCIANGIASHAEGCSTVASGIYAHSEGYQTTASENYAHSEGFGTRATGTAQHVQGKYNEEDSTMAHIIGNGTLEQPANIHTVDWNGNAWYAGTLSLGTGNDRVSLSAAELAALKALLQ